MGAYVLPPRSAAAAGWKSRHRRFAPWRPSQSTSTTSFPMTARSILRGWLQELRAYYDDLVEQPPSRDALLARDFQEALIASYERVTPLNRGLNDKRYHFRALAASHLVRSLLWALGAAPVIFVSDKIGLLPRISP
jgi:hypothetical protein